MGRLIDEPLLQEKLASIPMEERTFRRTVEELENAPTVEAIPKADYENRLKADLVATLTELQLEIEEKFNDRPFSYNHHQRTEFYRDIDEVIQQRINDLRGEK